MCGIIGYASKSFKNYDLQKSLELLCHRGPDSQNYIHYDNCGLGMVRLAIIDIENGLQPMSDISNRYSIIYNGEIFNANSLREILIDKGYVFKSKNSDTEVILAAYVIYGDKCVEKFNGMFSFVIYDNYENILFGAIDSFGIKPMYFTKSHNILYFSSEINALINLSKINKDLNYESIFNYFQLQYIPFDQTIYNNIFKLTPNTYFKYSINNDFFKLFNYEKNIYNKFDFKINDLDNYLNSAIIDWSSSEKKIGLSLSGGLDSSLIAYYLKRNKIDFEAFTLSYKDYIYKDYNENKITMSFCKKHDINLNQVTLDHFTFKHNLETIFKHLQEPYAGGLPSFFVYKAMKENNLKVALTGVGGDEIFGNYGKWKKYYDLILFLKLNIKSLINDKNYKISNYHGNMYTKFNSITTINSLFLSNQCNSNLNSQIEKIIDNSSEYFSFKHIQRKIDINLQLPYEFLFMTDRLSMANSIEARTPFLDKNLYNYICNVDINKISKQSDPKFALRKLFNLNIKDFNLPSLKKGFVIPDELFYNSNKELFNYLTSFSFLKSQNIFNYNLDIFKENKIKENKNLFKCFIHFQLFYFYNVYES